MHSSGGISGLQARSSRLAQPVRSCRAFCGRQRKWTRGSCVIHLAIHPVSNKSLSLPEKAARWPDNPAKSSSKRCPPTGDQRLSGPRISEAPMWSLPVLGAGRSLSEALLPGSESWDVVALT